MQRGRDSLGYSPPRLCCNTCDCLPHLHALSHSPTLRSWPGNPTGGDNVLSTQCWDPAKVVRVRIVDSCPCKQVGLGVDQVYEGGGLKARTRPGRCQYGCLSSEPNMALPVDHVLKGGAPTVKTM